MAKKKYVKKAPANKAPAKKAPAKKAPAKKATKAPPSKISQAEYDKMLNSGYMFAARELNEDAVRANRIANMMAPGFGLTGKGRVAKGPPPRPLNPNRRLNPSRRKPK